MSDQHALAFDRYQRFSATADLVLAKSDGDAPLNVLDVGSLDNTFAPFLPGHEITPFTGVIGRHAGPAPFDDGSFDVVVCLDVLEHVPAADRTFFIAELARVARRGFVLGFPVAQAAEAEHFVFQMTGSRWLAEHQALGLPEPAEVEAVLTALNLTWTRHPNGALPSWTAMMLLMHGLDVANRTTLCRFFNEHYSSLENREPAYRYLYDCEPKDL